MSDNIEKDALTQHWVHSHEEDTDREMVFRPANYKFPPSRGRDSFELKPDGALMESGPGPTDRTERSEGKWKLDANNNLVFSESTGRNPQPRVMQLASAGKDRLVLKK